MAKNKTKSKKRRLNIKVAIIGIVVLGIIAGTIMLAWYKRGRDPQKYIIQAEAALVNKDYKTAEAAYGTAYNFAGHTERVNILFKLAEIALTEDPGDAQLNREPKEPNWRKAMGYFNQITLIDPKNIDARLRILEYVYETGNTGQANSWEEVKKVSQEIINLCEENNEQPDLFVLLTRGRASLEIAITGQTTNIQEEVDAARQNLIALLRREPDNYDALWYLAHAEIIQGEINANAGILNGREEGVRRAEIVISESIDRNPDNPDAYLNMLKLRILQSQDAKASAQARAKLEDEQRAVKNRFPDNPEIDYEMAGFYMTNPKEQPRSLELIERALSINPEKMDYVIRGARIAHINSNLQDDEKLLDRALELALAGLELPDAQPTSGPNEIRNRNNRLILHNFSIRCFVDKALLKEQQKRDEYIAGAEEHLHQIKQILGISENPLIFRWDGMIDLAKGDKVGAVRKLSHAYEQYDAMNNPDPELAYDLSQAIAGAQEIGARQKYLGTAIKNGITSLGYPEAILQFAELLLQLRSPDAAISLIQRYEEVMAQSQWSQDLLINAYIQANLTEKAESLLANYKQDSVKTLNYRLSMAYTRLVQLVQMKSRQELLMESFNQTRINALADEINDLRVKRLQYAKQILEIDPEKIDHSVITGICLDLVSENLTADAIALNEKFLTYNPDHFGAKVLRKKLSEPNPTTVSEEKTTEIQIQVAQEVKDDFDRAQLLGTIYSNSGEFSKALEQFQITLKLKPDNPEVIAAVFDAAVAAQKFDIAEGLWSKIVEHNIDDCHGSFFTGRLAMAREDYDKAVLSFTECTEIKPLFAVAYLNLSIIYNAKNELDRAIEFAQKAIELNPLNSQITMNHAMLLYNRNQKLGSSTTINQKNEASNALLRAIKMNPSNINLQSIYAEYIFDTDPGNALAIRQSIFKSNPTRENALLLARTALRNATDAWDSPKKKAMYRIAEDAYKNALAIAPGDMEVLDAYADFFRVSGQEEKIVELVGDNKQIMWRAYYRSSKFEQAKELLDDLYAQNPNSVEIVKGLIGTSLKLYNIDDVDRYTKELLSIENNFDNRLLRVQALVEVGAITKAEEELEQLSDSDRAATQMVMLEATISLRKGLFAEAVTKAEQAIKQDPQNAIAWRIKGRANYLQAKYEQALQDYQKSKAIQEDNTIRIELAKAYDRMARYEPAIAELNLTLEEEGTPRIALILLEEIYLRSMKYGQLREYYDNMTARYTEDSYWEKRRADLEKKLGNLKLAEKYYLASWQRSLDNDSANLDSVRGYFDVLLEQGQYTELLSFAARYVDNDYASVMHTAMGEARAKMGNIESSLESFSKAMDTAGYSFMLIDMAVRRMLNTIELKQVMQWVEQNLKLSPNSINRNLVAFYVNLQSQSYNKAIKHLDECIKIEDNPSNLRRALVITKANTLQVAYNNFPDKEYLERAIGIYEELIEQTPGDVSLLNNLAYLLATSEIDTIRAEEIAARAYSLAPENGLILDTYGLALIKNRKYDEAEQLLRRAIQTLELTSTSAPYVVYENLGLALERLNKPQEAKAAYERVLEIGGDELTETQKKDITERISKLSRRIF